MDCPNPSSRVLDSPPRTALAGFALFLLIGPIQQQVMAFQFRTRQRSMTFTEQRAQTLLEALGSMRVVKYFTYEMSFLGRIAETRKKELRAVRSILHAESANMALAHTVPYLAATLAFITYTRVTNEFDVAVVFASLALFQLLRQPMMFLPRGLSVIADARSALSRLDRVFHAELTQGDLTVIRPEQPWGLLVEDATFEWEEVLLKGEKSEETLLEKVAQTPFQLKNLTMRIERGKLVAIVGRVGSGKSSLLQAIIGEMRRLSGNVSFGGRIAYCPQTAWIQNASLRNNITFGLPFEEERYWRAVEDACLLPDLQMLADGDLTEILTLAKVNIARALYFGAEVIIMDDPLSAVDAHVGKSLFHGAIAGLAKSGKTVVFVTHALHFLSFCDYIYTLNAGRISEHGTYRELIEAQGEFARLDEEFGGQEAAASTSKGSQSAVLEEVQNKTTELRKRHPGKGTLEGKLIVKETRNTGTIGSNVWLAYLSAGRGFITIPLLLLAAVLMQGSQIISSYLLVWWQANLSDEFSEFLERTSTVCFFLVPVVSSIHPNQVVDNQLPISMRMLILTVAGVVGTIITIGVIEPYFIIVAFFVATAYHLLASFYRASAREIKRLDSMLRSLLYSHLSESLTGLSTLRSYGQLPRFVRDNEFFIDLESRAIFLAHTNQRWLTVRLDVCGGVLIFFVRISFMIYGAMVLIWIHEGRAVLSAQHVRHKPCPSRIDIDFYNEFVPDVCHAVPTNCGSRELYERGREKSVSFLIFLPPPHSYVHSVSHYSDPKSISQEPPHENPDSKPGPQWPEKGSIEFSEVSMKYRPGLPNVLHSISMSIRGGEKIGVVGRTGAGKSSLVMTLMRIVEYTGTITIDGLDISKIGLKDLRSKISIIPQDPTVFSGTVRAALDPFSLYDDARLWDALRRSFLVEPDGTASNLHSEKGVLADPGSSTTARITLDTILEAEGLNLSVGERSLLSLARALVKETKVVILDEATASVDLETDKKIQQTIQTEFVGKTLICIAHRLRTILGYDRILVLDAGNIAEFDTPTSLFNKEDGIFRGLCLRSNITARDIHASTAN
ncbi:hypothetical protein MD484_g8498, partial [Candolleomyces efflorescens]